LKYALLKTCLALWLITGFTSAILFTELAAAQSNEASEVAPSPALEGKRSPEISSAKHVDDALMVVRQLESDATMRKLLQDASGVFIVPTYGRAALGIGAHGGAGVLLVKKASGNWTNPVFYNIGGISIGAQAGSVAFVLNNDKAVQRFTDKNNFSLSADTGLTVINWAKVAEGSTGAGDATAWTATKGLFGNVATIGVNDIRFNQRLTNAYYKQTRNVASADIINGKFSNAGADSLKQALANISSGSASGSSTGKSESSQERR
jgi:lipid-binding SYLF domain-containing protein